jgi:ABC-type polysaccharide/polyol phosphate transport system ATPase subunit
MSTAIEVRGVGKRYRLGEHRAAYGTLRDSITAAVTRSRRRSAPEDEIWALRDVDLTVEEGAALGIVGNNGAGKSTLLRILARITEPTIGVSRTRGRVGALLEVGTGFHDELTGSENVFLCGAVMGMTRREVRQRFDEIVAFAGVEPFLATPLKRYSSGMRLRLAFAVAAHLEPELMLVDEILAVGDVDFQRRCLTRMGRLSDEGRTVVFVSHDLGAVARLCPRAIWMYRGRIVSDGDSQHVVQEYYASVVGQASSAELDVEGDVGVRRVTIVDEQGEVLSRPPRDEPLCVEARVLARRPVPGLDMAVWIVGTDGTRLLDEAWSDQSDVPELAPAPGEYAVRLRVPPLLRAGEYVVGIWLGTEITTFVAQDILSFPIAPLPSDRQEWTTRRRVVQPPVSWSVRSLAGMGQ